MNINYELIGTFPQMDAYRDELPVLMGKKYISEIDHRIIETCAQHFYGFDPRDFDSITGLIDAIRAADQELEAK